MIEVNKKMSWDELTQEFGGKIIFADILSKHKGPIVTDPVEVYVYSIIECEADKKIVCDIRNVRKGSLYKIPSSTSEL